MKIKKYKYLDEKMEYILVSYGNLYDAVNINLASSFVKEIINKVNNINRNIIEIESVYLKPEHRGKRLMYNSINDLICGSNDIIILTAGPHHLEHGINKMDEVELKNISFKISKFYENLGFIDISKYMDDKRYIKMIYNNNTGKDIIHQFGD